MVKAPHKLPSLHSLFLRLHLTIGLSAVFIIVLGIGASDYLTIRRVLLVDITYTVQNIAKLYATTSPKKALSRINHLQIFDNHPGLAMLCLYDVEGRRMASWQADGSRRCPELLIKEGLEEHFFSLKIAQPIRQQNNYIGMVYAEGTLHPTRIWLTQMAVLLLALLSVVGVAGVYATKRSTRSLGSALGTLHEQIECLKESEGAVCIPARPFRSREMQEMADSLTELRTHLSRNMVKREIFARMHDWHWDVLSGLLSGLRQRISADSPLLDGLEDYALLLQTERGDLLPPPTTFTLSDVVSRALAATRRLYPRNPRVNLTVSLQSRIAQNWVGHPEILEALLRHLLLIGLSRTRSGFVFLRLEVVIAPMAAQAHTLRILYEDSGTALQPGQLQQALVTGAHYNATNAVTQDISWLLMPRLFKRLDGTLNNNTTADTGLVLEGNLPMAIQPNINLGTVSVEHSIAPRARPLILTVENDKEHQLQMTQAFAAVQCDLFIVETHAQAVELAPIVPISAILLNAAQADIAEDIPRRLRHAMDDGIMTPVPLWVTLTRSGSELEYWRKRHINEILMRPFRPELLHQICTDLAPCDPNFYTMHDELLRGDLSPTILASMPVMNQMLASQLDQLKPLLASFITGEPYTQVTQQAHAVKSAALTLGYFRLAALMGEIEHARASQLFTAYPPNGTCILALLDSIHLNEHITA